MRGGWLSIRVSRRADEIGAAFEQSRDVDLGEVRDRAARADCLERLVRLSRANTNGDGARRGARPYSCRAVLEDDASSGVGSVDTQPSHRLPVGHGRRLGLGALLAEDDLTDDT